MSDTDKDTREAFEAWYDPLYLGDMNLKDAATREYAFAAWQAASRHRPKVDEAAKTQAAPVFEEKRRLVDCPSCKSVFGVATPSPIPRAELAKVRELLRETQDLENPLDYVSLRDAAKEAIAILDKYLLTPADK